MKVKILLINEKVYVDSTLSLLRKYSPFISFFSYITLTDK